jgi:hypothetical protein
LRFGFFGFFSFFLDYRQGLAALSGTPQFQAPRQNQGPVTNNEKNPEKTKKSKWILQNKEI